METITNCHGRSFWTGFLLVIIAGGFYITGKYIETVYPDTHRPVSITVQGEGKITSASDIATLNFGVQTGRQETSQEAMQILTERMDAVIRAVKSQGVTEKDIRTDSLSLTPAYNWDEGKRIEAGFEAQQNLTVKVRDIGQVGDVLGAATDAGANQVGNVSFTIDDPEELQEQARDEAIADAKTRAAELAAQLGKSLGKLQGYSENGYGNIPLPVRAYVKEESLSMAMDAAGAVPVPAGEQELTMTVSLTYLLK